MTDITQLRRLPWQEDDRPAFVSPGDGIVNRLADVLEDQMIDTARLDAARARALADDSKATPAEMRTALRFLAGSLQDAALVATLRGERLGLEDDDADTAVIGGQVLRCLPGQAADSGGQ
ncbi:hypothetical protein [Streptomyces sp. Ru87]|uniref:hypothetical protein n=1 Tax=Streptomyces sp. Ru87 TaxID=2044307 RepID=UPI000BF5781E|nr:hypothetical protein [Streptomyces sp. Ru87]PGH49940.1 hypothetical protein CRI70_14835 [Streptomyces sp. Ru87]